MTKKLLSIFALASLLFVMSCGDDEDCNTKGLTYNKDIKTLISGCASASCHASGSNVGSLSNYTDTKAFVAFGRILGAVKHSTGFSPMPKGGTKWSDCNISKLEAWINAGMPE
jgi:hypothetical protein